MIPGLQRTFAAASALFLAVAADAQLPVGPEQQVNEYTTSFQNTARVAGTPDGGFVVAWFSAGPCGDRDDTTNAQGRVFMADGEPAGSQFRVNEVCDWLRNEYPRSVLVDDDGELTIVWADVHSRPEGSYFGGSARRFAADGAPLGSEFVVAPALGYAESPVADGSPGGEFVVARALESSASYSYYVKVARFDPSGAPEWNFPIEPSSGHGLARPDVDVAPAGDFVVAWLDADWPLVDIRMRRFDFDGTPLGEVIDVTGPGASGLRTAPNVERNGAGNFLVVWQDAVSVGDDTSFTSVQARAFDATGAPLGPQIQVNDGTIGRQANGVAAAAPDGSFVVAWTDDPYGEPGGGDGAGAGIRARKVAADGTLLGPGFSVNSYTTGEQSSPSIAFLVVGDFVAAWSSDGSFGDDDSDSSIQYRRFRLVLFADGFESGDTSRWSGAAGGS